MTAFPFLELYGETLFEGAGITDILTALGIGAVIGIVLYVAISISQLMSLITTFFYVALKMALGVFKTGACGAAGTAPTFGEALVLAIILGIVVVANILHHLLRSNGYHF